MFTIVFLSALCAWGSVYSISDQQNDGQGELANSDGDNQAALPANLQAFENEGNAVSRGKRASMNTQALAAFEIFFTNDANAIASPKGNVPPERRGPYTNRRPLRSNRTRAFNSYEAPLVRSNVLGDYFARTLVRNNKANNYRLRPLVRINKVQDNHMRPLGGSKTAHDYLLRPLARNHNGNDYLTRPLLKNNKGNEYLTRPLLKNNKGNDYLTRPLLKNNKGNDYLTRLLLKNIKGNDYLTGPLLKNNKVHDYYGRPLVRNNKNHDYLGRHLARHNGWENYNRPLLSRLNSVSNYPSPAAFGHHPLHRFNEAALPKESILPNNVRVVWKTKGGLNRAAGYRHDPFVKDNRFAWNSHSAKLTRPINRNSPIIIVSPVKRIGPWVPARHDVQYIQKKSWNGMTSTKKSRIHLGWF